MPELNIYKISFVLGPAQQFRILPGMIYTAAISYIKKCCNRIDRNPDCNTNGVPNPPNV